ncbi:NRPS protein [Diaporthe australafricana]|uniref:NRPS protein n=1 Tax=Diaporthe australafricana TaxID=127596 RepID=A0ABR3WZ42_9PEZI
MPFNLSAGLDDRVLLILSFAFDACAYVILSTLCNGATLVLSSPVTLAEVANTCTIWITTPSILSAMDPTRGYKDVKWIIMGGESPTPSLIKNWSIPNRKLINAYGPTEATCVVSMAELLPGAPITMGWPVSYCKVLLVDADDNEADEGELLLGGPGIAVGYLGDEELTRKTFVRRGSKGEIFYRTKDYARRTADGYVFCGRKDGVVKNRGFLVNLDSEVEPAMMASSGGEPSAKVQQCAAIKSPEGSLVGFVCPESAAEGLRERMLERYSAFWVPDIIYGVDSFALTANGKIDRKALAALHEKTQLPQFLNADIFLQHVRDQGKFITPLEAVRHAICTVLRVVQARVGDHASFRALGGHSLNAVMLVSTLRKLGFLTDVATIYSEDTVAAIASALERTDAETGEACSLEATETDRTSFREALASSTGELDDVQIFPATDMQARMVRGTVENPSMNFLKIGMTFDHPDVDHAVFLRALHQSWSALVKKHSILRTSFRLDTVSEPVQVSDEAYTIEWQEKSVHSEAEWNLKIERTARFESGELISFDERDAHALSRVRVFSLPGIKTRVVWTVHHALIDGWSASIVLHDLWELLHSTQEAQALCPQFSDAAWCLRKLTSRDSGIAKAFWKELLQAHSQSIPRLRIPPPSTEALKPQPQAESHRKLSVRMDQMIDAAKERGVTTVALVYSAWAILLSRYCDSKAVVLGAVLSGRSLPLDGVEKIIGPLVNTLPLPAAVDPDMAVTEFLQQTFLSLCRLLDFQWTPNSLIQEATGFRGTEYYDTLLAIQYDFPASEWPEHEPRLCSPPYDVSYVETTEMPLTVMLDVVDGYLDARFLYQTAMFSDTMVERMMGHFENILVAFLDACLEDPRQSGHTVGGISDKMLGREELQERVNCTGRQLEEPYQGPETLPDALEASLKSHRDLHAVEGLDRSLTYGELDDATARISRVLGECGVKPGKIVCVVADGSVEWLLAIMAVVRTGAAYCPVDHKLPWERQKYMISACSPPLVLFSSKSSRKASLGFESVPVLLDVETILSVDGMKELPNNFGEGANDFCQKTQTPRSDEVAVVIFTSGSTGFPKAVQLQHKGILSLLSHAPARLYSKPGQRNAQLLSLGFDCCVIEVFSSLLYGATLVLKDTSDPLAHLSKVDATVGTPSLISSLDPIQYPNLKILTLVGEALPSVLVQKWLPGRMIQNGYAPAECTLIATAHPLQPNTPISIGKPVPRMNFYLLDSTGRPVPLGVTGEIHISGIQVTPGYLNNAQETKARFLPDPFREGWTMFRTGDMGRWLESGDIEYIGRNDSQVKVRGFRLDLGDVEASILRVAEDIIDNVAVVVTSVSLRAFVTPETVSTEKLLQALRQHLPDYSTPNIITALKELPVSRNGKVDRAMLSEMRLERNSGVEPLVTQTERDVAKVWAELLGRDLVEDPIGASDGFFDIGGHSLLQIRLAQRLSKLWEIKVPLRVIIRHQVLRDLCRVLDEHLGREQNEKRSGQQVPAVKENNCIKGFADTQRSTRSERMQASYLEQEMVLNQLLCGGSPIWNIVYSCNVYGPLDMQRLATAYQRTLEKYEVLRSRFHIEDDGTVTRSIFPAGESTLQNYSCGAEDDVGEFVSKTVQRPMDPFKEPLFQMHTTSITPWKTTIIVIISHIIGDGPTLHHALGETSAEYSRSAIAGSSDNLEESNRPTTLGLNYLDWSSWASNTLLSPPTDDTVYFWKSHLSTPESSQPLGPLAQAHSYRGRTRTWIVRPEHHRRLVALIMAHGITMHQLALGATFLALQSLQARPARGGLVTVALGAPMTMRTEVGTEEMLGMLLDRLVVPLAWDFGASAGDATPGGSDSLEGFFSMVGDRSRAALAHFVPHRVLRDILRGNDAAAPNNAEPSLVLPLFQVMVSFHTAVETAGGRLSLEGVETVEREDARPMCAKFPVMVEFTDKGNRGLQVELECADGALDKERADRLENAMALVLELLGAGVGIDEIVRVIADTTVRQDDGLPTPQSEREEFNYRQETKGKAGSTSGDDRAAIIKEAVSQCLGGRLDDSSDSDTFWEQGANSMDALVLQKLCEKKGVDLDLRAMFETPDITAW